MNKKASLELSIQAIVIVVIAFVVLGLALGFVKGTFKDITGTSADVQSKIKERILEDLRTSGKKLSIGQEIRLERGDEIIENVGIVNTGITTSRFGIKIIPIKKQKPDGTTVTNPVEIENEVTFFYNELIEKELAPTDGDVIPITITAKSSASGTYLYKVNVLREESTGACDLGEVGAGCTLYDTRSFFVKVS